MKTVLLLAFLAIGPALADQTPVVPAFYETPAAAPVASAGRLRATARATARATDRVAAQASLSADERARLCGS